ncbi:MAG: putative 4-hydroxybenzoate polyprenyltransferase [Planctomycetes bacterium]|nr:putative 4-hydroxybenzoate polyprenyltransferase [Planctomycetota bacterium]
MIALLVATRDEAASLLDALQAQKLGDTPFETHWFPARRRRPAGFVIITGMGPAAAAAAARHILTTQKVQHLFNAGVCGALRAGFEPGGVYHIMSAADGDALLLRSAGEERGQSTFLPENHPAARAEEEKVECPLLPFFDLPAARLTSVSEPVFGDARRTRLAAAADLLDMEGHAIADAAARHGIPCTLIKGVSDLALDGSREDLHRNLRPVSQAVAERLMGGLERWPREPGSLPRRLANFVKVEHTLFSLPLLFAGAWIGAGGRMPSVGVLLLVSLAGLGARALGMAMNRILDRRLDLLNPRTAGRELPSGRMTAAQAWSVALLGLLVYGLACAALGPVCLRLSPIPALVLIGYSLLKRFTALCHFGIGLALALGPLGAYVAVTSHLPADPAILFLAAFTFLWISGFDIIYALQDLESDRRTGVHSLPVALGSRGAQVVAALVHAVAAFLAVALWRRTGGGLIAALPLTVLMGAFVAAYYPRLPLPVRFFPVSALASTAGALIPLLGGLP